ncbi:hypothetical protein KB559_03855 [Paenibacillus sp. Marseille-P2973]|uniref:hypothetical protein n=1 Tax=Paenibacillus sp. Marseille-P2973 TaxID=1871032 RepID=UPI001B3846A8|nr:hypothetical protein [Paenibacillus sp. Marseille-P2973]MBQ4897966.1 hypothetical protein [Paenibacillus sp. Marseille-P2973]
MLFVFLMAGAIVNAILATIGGAVFIVGVVFFLIGVPQFKSSGKKINRNLLKEVFPICVTLLTLILYMIIAYWSSRTAGTLAFSLSDPSSSLLNQAKKLTCLGIVQGLFSFVAMKWLLPRLIGELGLEKKHIWGISIGFIFTITNGIAAWLS